MSFFQTIWPTVEGAAALAGPASGRYVRTEVTNLSRASPDYRVCMSYCPGVRQWTTVVRCVRTSGATRGTWKHLLP